MQGMPPDFRGGLQVSDSYRLFDLCHTRPSRSGGTSWWGVGSRLWRRATGGCDNEDPQPAADPPFCLGESPCSAAGCRRALFRIIRLILLLYRVDYSMWVGMYVDMS